MTSINLSQESKQVKPKKSILEQGVLLAFIVLVLVVLVYGGLFVYEKTLMTKLKTFETEIANTLNSAKNEEIERVLDFDIRGKEVNKHILKGDYVGFMLTEIEKSMVSGVFVKKINEVRQNSAIEIIFASENLDNIAKQVLSLKQSDAVSATEILSSDFDNDGLWTIEVKVAYLANVIDDTLKNK